MKKKQDTIYYVFTRKKEKVSEFPFYGTQHKPQIIVGVHKKHIKEKSIKNHTQKLLFIYLFFWSMIPYSLSFYTLRLEFP